jgi:hypothetical protein
VFREGTSSLELESELVDDPEPELPLVPELVELEDPALGVAVPELVEVDVEVLVAGVDDAVAAVCVTPATIAAVARPPPSELSHATMRIRRRSAGGCPVMATTVRRRGSGGPQPSVKAFLSLPGRRSRTPTPRLCSAHLE